jgi:signal transduction histidine kinase
MRRPSTVRSKLTLLATLLVVLVLTVSAAALVLTQERVLVHGIDESLVQRADNLEAAVLGGTFDARLPSDGDPEDTFLQLLDSRGEVVAESANASALPAAASPPGDGDQERIVTVTDVPLSNGEFRVLVRRLEGPADETHFLVVAKNLDDVSESVDVLASSLAIAVPAVTALLALLVWWLTGRVLRPVEAIRVEVAGIRGDDLHRRVPDPRTEDEIADLARTMNQMLARVETATERQRRFVADASHELRGPLTRLRSHLEVSLAHPEVVPTGELLHGLLADVTDLQQLVESLLFLARLESEGSVPNEPVDLDDLVLDESQRLRARCRVGVDVTSVGAARTAGDAAQLARAIANLAGNAERHAGSQVTFELREQDGRCELVVADDGPGIPPDQRDEVFKRFTRLDEARSRDAGGSGLGLAIVHDIVTRHAGTVRVEDAPSGGARFVVDLPRAD